MPLEITHSRRARRDIGDIWRYIVVDNEAAAARVLRKIMSVIVKLADFPQIGRLRPELRSGMRSFSAGAYVIFYEQRPNEIYVVRIIHGKRDFKPHMFSPESDD